MDYYSVVVVPIIMIIMMYFLVFKPNNKRKKEEEKMRSNLSIGDEIITVGGIVGRIINIKEGSDSFIIETSADRSKISVKRWAIAGKEKAQ